MLFFWHRYGFMLIMGMRRTDVIVDRANATGSACNPTPLPV